jgi:hypothetical protein
MRVLVLSVLAIGLSACNLAIPDDGATASKRKGTALTKATLARGDIVLSGPNGYCIDKASLATGTNRSFALIAGCNAIAGGAGIDTRDPAVMTVGVAPNRNDEVAPTPAQMAEALEAPFLSGVIENGISVARIGSLGDAVLENGDPTHWRGAFQHNGYMVGIALYAPEGGFMSGPAGATLIQDLAANIRKLSPKQAAPTPAAPTETTPEVATDATPAAEAEPTTGRRGLAALIFRKKG